MTKVRTRSNSASASVPVSKQVKIQFQFNGADLGEKGTVDVLNFVIASGGTVTRSGDTIIVTITGGGGGAITDGQGTTANGTAVDLGGTVTAPVVVDLTTHPFEFVGGVGSAFRTTDGLTAVETVDLLAGLFLSLGIFGANTVINFSGDNIIISDGRATPKGLKYASHFAFAGLDDESLITKKHLTDYVGVALTRVIITTQVVNNEAVANTLKDVTGLQFPVVANKLFYFRFVIPFSAQTTNVGARFAINGPTLTRLNWKDQHNSTQFIMLSTADSAYESGTLAASSMTTGNMDEMVGIIECSAVGNVIARFASDFGGASITVLPGAFVEYLQLN